MHNCYILIGLPGVGKSTWVEREFQGDCWVVSTDAILDEIAAEEDITYNEAFSKYSKVTEPMMWKNFDSFIENKFHPIVIDRTNMSVKSRAKIFNRLKNFHKGHGYKIHAVVFSKPDDIEHNRRLNSRPGKTIPENVIRNMENSYQCPTIDEGFDNILYIKG